MMVLRPHDEVVEPLRIDKRQCLLQCLRQQFIGPAGLRDSRRTFCAKITAADYCRVCWDEITLGGLEIVGPLMEKNAREGLRAKCGALFRDAEMAERAGFEPALGDYPKHAFQACDLNRSSTSP
jgi:hypothetical protein